MNQRVGNLLFVMAGASALFGCATDVGTEDPALRKSTQAVLGGELAEDAKYAAVGSLVIVVEYPGDDEIPAFTYYEPFCSGTLIEDTAVLTARHCTQAAAEYQAAGLEVAFAFGSWTYEPDQVVAISGWKEAKSSKTHPGLLLDGGRDIAVVYLADEPVGIRPAKIAEFDKKKQLKSEFEIVGFGYNDYYLEEYGFYDVGTRIVGKVGGRAIQGQWYSLLFGGKYDDYLEWYFTDAVTGGEPSEEEASAWWDIYSLEPGYELLAGGRPGEALGCFGDSGGPLAIAKKKQLTVYGVSFGVEASQSTICTRGGAYLVLNKEIYSFVQKATRHCSRH